MLSLATYVSTFLQAARSSELHTASTLDLLCRVALDAHYSSGLSPIGSIVSFTETPVTILNTIHDAMELLRASYTELSISHSHQIISSASELLVLLLPCVSDYSQIPHAQAAMHYSNAHRLLTIPYRLEPEVRQMLESYLVALSISMGDDTKAAEEAQMIQSMQLTLGKPDVQGSGRDIITFGLMLHQWV